MLSRLFVAEGHKATKLQSCHLEATSQSHTCSPASSCGVRGLQPDRYKLHEQPSDCDEAAISRTKDVSALQRRLPPTRPRLHMHAAWQASPSATWPSPPRGRARTTRRCAAARAATTGAASPPAAWSGSPWTCAAACGRAGRGSAATGAGTSPVRRAAGGTRRTRCGPPRSARWPRRIARRWRAGGRTESTELSRTTHAPAFQRNATKTPSRFTSLLMIFQTMFQTRPTSRRPPRPAMFPRGVRGDFFSDD